MPEVLEPVRPAVRRLHRPLLLMVASMTLLLAVSAVGMVTDDRVLLGASVWAKPLKFAVSFIVYGLTLAWLLSLPHKAGRWTWWMATLLAVTGMVDVGVVVVQAARGTFSHFNQADDPFTDGIMLVFGIGVQLLMLANFVLAGLLIFQRVGDRVLAWAIRAGLAFVIAGIGLGFWIPARSAEVWTAIDAAGHAVPPWPPSTTWASRTAAPGCRSPAGARSAATCASRTSSACTDCRSCWPWRWCSGCRPAGSPGCVPSGPGWA
ncbi:hypothetical protein [Nonomuraea salmonea]|uniref:hypothetical protein n=1 Tax=Nonomuraea salmonea TaxID=46181 RepID=UPI002FEDD607